MKMQQTNFIHVVFVFALSVLSASCAFLQIDEGDKYTFVEDDRLQQAEERMAKQVAEEAYAAQQVVIKEAEVEQEPDNPGDLLTSIADQMTWQERYGGYKGVAYELDRMADQEYLDKMFNNASAYLHFIVNEVRARNMPMEIALLPGVESMYKSHAYSYAHAAGMWQIIPGTGKRLGLEINWWYDGRRDVKFSTDAALSYLEYLAERLDGDWLLALASYNAGIGRINNAKKRNKKQKKPTDYWALTLPKQTERYVPRLIALSMIVSNPERYGVTLPAIPDKPYFVELQTREQLDFYHLSNAIDIPLEELIALNSGYNQRFTDPVKQHNLLVPVPLEEAATEYIQDNNHMDEFWITYKVDRRQTLGSLAERFNTSTEKLHAVNKLTKGDYVRAGKYLLVPVNRKEFDRYIAYHSSDPMVTGKPKRKSVYHKLVRGDSLWVLSRKYNVSLKNLLRWNNISSTTRLYAGKSIIVNHTVYRPRVDPIVLKPEYEHAVVMRVLYPVRRGNSLYSISDKFNVAVEDIILWNPEVSKKGLRHGTTLELFVDVTEVY